MDKETLSNYGWIVICVLVMVVMIALATPFGSFISEAVQSTTKGLFDVNKSALDSTGLINIDNQEFDVPDMNHGATQTETPGATFFGYLANPGCHNNPMKHTDGCFVNEEVTLTWDELKLAENGQKYWYSWTSLDETELNAFRNCLTLKSITIPDGVTSIGNEAFRFCTALESITLPDSITTINSGAFSACKSLTNIKLPNNLTTIGASAFSACSALTSITIPDSVTSIGDMAFNSCSSLSNFNFEGTILQWNSISIVNIDHWQYNNAPKEVICSDGTVSLS